MQALLFTYNYRYGYQGSEMDNEVNSSKGSSYTTEFRQLDPRLGRWFSVDPVFQPWQSPYTSMDNNPVDLTDVRGLSADNGEAKETSGGGFWSRMKGFIGMGKDGESPHFQIDEVLIKEKRTSWYVRMFKKASRGLKKVGDKLKNVAKSVSDGLKSLNNNIKEKLSDLMRKFKEYRNKESDNAVANFLRGIDDFFGQYDYTTKDGGELGPGGKGRRDVEQVPIDEFLEFAESIKPDLPKSIPSRQYRKIIKKMEEYKDLLDDAGKVIDMVSDMVKENMSATELEKIEDFNPEDSKAPKVDFSKEEEKWEERWEKNLKVWNRASHMVTVKGDTIHKGSCLNCWRYKQGISPEDPIRDTIYID